MSKPTEREKYESCALVRAGVVIAEGKWESLCHSQRKGDVTITYAPLRDIGRWDSAPRKRCWHAETARAHATVGRYATRDAAIKAAITFTACETQSALNSDDPLAAVLALIARA